MNKISTKHLMLFFVGATFISLKTYPSMFISLGGRDTWICALIASGLFILYISYLMHIMKRNNVYDINEIFKVGLSKTIGMIMLFLFGINLFFSAIESASVQANVIQSLYFLDTPVWYIVLFFLIPTVLLLTKNIRTVLVFTIISVASLIINSISFAIIIEKYKNINFLLPVLPNGIDKNFIICITLIFFSLCSLLIAMPFMKYLSDSNFLHKHCFLTNSIMCIFLVFSILGIISYFGPERAANIFYGEAIQGQRVQLGGFLEFGEFFFIYQTIVGFLVKYVLSAYALMSIFKKLSNNKFLFILIFTFLTFVLSSLISLNNYYLTDALKIYTISNGLIFFLVPLIAFTAYNLRDKKKLFKK